MVAFMQGNKCSSQSEGVARKGYRVSFWCCIKSW